MPAKRTLLLAAALFSLAPLVTHAQDASADARKLAQDILDKGSALFDKCDAKAIADSYADDAVIALFTPDNDTGRMKLDNTIRGHDAIESGYRDLYKDRQPTKKSRNVVETAKLLNKDNLLITGTFYPDTSEKLKVTFVQLRTKVGDAWKILHLQIVFVKDEQP